MLLLATTAFALPPENAAWTPLDDEPFRVECAVVSGETWCRGFGHSTQDVDALARVIEDRGNYPQIYRHIAKTDLVDGEVFRVELDLPPLVGDRDWIIRTRRLDEGGARYYRWVPADPDALPRVDGVLRLPWAAGEWKLTPSPSGGTDLRYTWQADYGGHLPNWLLNRIRTDTAAELLGDTKKAAGG